MADLMTLDGLQYYFDPAAVTAVADHDPDTLHAVTTVSGLTNGRLRLAEKPEAFLARIGATQWFARFTQMTDTFVWINCTAVAVLRAAGPDEHPDAQAVVVAGSQTFVVKESLLRARQMINTQGGGRL